MFDVGVVIDLSFTSFVQQFGFVKNLEGAEDLDKIIYREKSGQGKRMVPKRAHIFGKVVV